MAISKSFIDGKRFFMKEWGDQDMSIHSMIVIDRCLLMASITNLDSTVFHIAGWIHDIGRKDDKEKHHVFGIKYLKQFLKTHFEYRYREKEIKDCILNHRTGMMPKTMYGKIFQMADKIALLDNRWIEYKKMKK